LAVKMPVAVHGRHLTLLWFSNCIVFEASNIPETLIE